MSNKRLNKTIQKALKHNSRVGRCLWLDAYNNAVFDEFSPTIRTTIQTSCMNFIMEKEETNKEKVVNPLKGKSGKSWFFEQQVYSDDGIARSLKSSEGSGNRPKVIEYKDNIVEEPKICAMRGRADGEWHESEHEQRIECREDGVTNTIIGVSKDNMVAEPTIIQQVGDRGNGYYSEKDTAFTIPANPMSDRCQMVKEQIPLNTDQEGLATMVTTAHHYSGNIVDPKRGQKEMGVLEKHHQQDFVQHEDGISRALCAGSHGSASHLTKTMVSSNLGFRVRRLTERELFRLMDVSEEDIDKIQAAGISKTQQAKMAGNSICVNVLYHIFRKLYVDTDEENEQLSLF